MDYEPTDLSICQVCLHLLANGEYNDGTDAAETAATGMRQLWGADTIHLIADGDNLGFRTSPCDGCGQTDHGDRFRATALIPEFMPGGPEYTTTSAASGSLTIELAKVGGGTIGNAYDGRWAYVVTRNNGGAVLGRGDDLNTGSPKTHAEAADVLAEFYTLAED